MNLRFVIGLVLAAFSSFGLIMSQDWSAWTDWPGYLVATTLIGGMLLGGDASAE